MNDSRCWGLPSNAKRAADAVEAAFHSKSEHRVELLRLASCKASPFIRETLLYSPILKEAFESTDVKTIRCCLRIFGATTSSLSDIESRIVSEPIDRRITDARALSYAVTFAADESGSATYGAYTPALQSHWIWTVEGANSQDHIDIILAAGGVPSPKDISWLLWEAVTEDRHGRLDMLLRAGVSIHGQYHHFTYKQVQAMTLLYAGPKITLSKIMLTFMSPLSCAILCGRQRMVERLVAAGASINEKADAALRLAPIHFAALSDSLEAFKFLESHGADLDLKDNTGRTMADFLILRGARGRPSNSLSRYLVTNPGRYRNSCSWGYVLHEDTL
jgi:hypothetical protein